MPQKAVMCFHCSSSPSIRSVSWLDRSRCPPVALVVGAGRDLWFEGLCGRFAPCMNKEIFSSGRGAQREPLSGHGSLGHGRRVQRTPSGSVPDDPPLQAPLSSSSLALQVLEQGHARLGTTQMSLQAVFTPTRQPY